MPQDWKQVLPEWVAKTTFCSIDKPIAIPLNNYSIIACQGVEAKQFLQGQLSCNINDITDAQSLLACYCDHKGRMLASLWVALFNGAYIMVMPQNISSTFLDELSKFIIFSKVEIIDISAEYQHIGIISGDTHPLQEIQAISLFHQFNAPVLQQHAVVPKTTKFDELTKNFVPTNQDFWDLVNIRNGLITITPDTVGHFTPHQVNFAQLGGVSLKKGCYRGQEIIARMQYLGKLKQHLYHCKLRSEKSYQSGTELHDANEQTIGKIANLIKISDKDYELIAVLKDSVVKENNQIELMDGTLQIIKKF